MTILLLGLIGALSVFVGSLLVDGWSFLSRAVWVVIGSLPLISWVSNTTRMPIPVEIEIAFFFGGVVAGIAILSRVSKQSEQKKIPCALLGALSVVASLCAGMLSTGLYLLP